MSWSERGDTIVEVLFAIAIIGFVLGASYASASRSTQLGRDAQEHTQALKLAETQLERLKYIASTLKAGTIDPGSNIFDSTPTNVDFCIDETLVKVIIPNTVCDLVDGSPFSQKIHFDTKGDSDPTNDIFLVTISWDRIVSGPKGNVQLVYKLHNDTN